MNPHEEKDSFLYIIQIILPEISEIPGTVHTCPSTRTLRHELLFRLHRIMVYAYDILLRRTVAEAFGNRYAMRIGRTARHSCRLMTTDHGAYTPWIGYTLDVGVQSVVGKRMTSEPLHHSTRLAFLRSTAAIDQPIDLNRREFLHAMQEIRNGGVLHRHDELVEIYHRYPARLGPVSLETMIVCGELTFASGPIKIIDKSRLYIRFEHLSCAIGAFVVVDIKLLDTHLVVPFNPFLEIRPLVLGYRAHGEVIFWSGVVVSQSVLKPDDVQYSITQEATPSVACHLARYHSGNNFGKCFLHFLINLDVNIRLCHRYNSKLDFSGSMLSKALRMFSITCS